MTRYTKQILFPLSLSEPFFFFLLGGVTEKIPSQMSKHFELLNYSEHGTVVDNIVYCCDVSIPASSKRLDDSKDDSDEGTSAKDKTNILFNGLDDLLRRNSDADKTNTYENLFTDPHDQVFVAVHQHSATLPSLASFFLFVLGLPVRLSHKQCGHK